MHLLLAMDTQKDADVSQEQTEAMPKNPSVAYMLGLPMSAEAHQEYVDNMVATAERILAADLERMSRRPPPHVPARPVTWL